MLNVSKAMVASAVRGYFQQGGHDYYIDGYNPPGIWGGELAKEWGLQGQVKKEHFDRLADGYHPITGEDLTQQRRDESARRAANDITISAPKPCTLLYVRTADERIPQAFVDACDEVMAMMEPDAGVRVRMNGADYDRKTGNWAY